MTPGFHYECLHIRHVNQRRMPTGTQVNQKPPASDEALASVFEERAENLSETELEKWTTYTSRDEAIVRKLMGPGVKLVIGPRGSGKSTLLRTAYFRLLREIDVLPAYVNYSRSLALEPLFHTHANALQIFRQWVIAKVIVGVAEALAQTKRQAPSGLETLAASGKQLIRRLEQGSPPESFERLIGPSELLELLEEWCSDLGIRRCVLLLDDAAHAFSPEQQREFFEVFRELRSRRVAGKAAVYPGITSYSPHFHVGHEAELLEAWYRPEESDYLQSMRKLVQKRLPENLRAHLSDREELVDYLALAAFGLPRGFLNMLSQLFGIEEGAQGKPTRLRADAAVRDHAESVGRIFRALSGKLPRLKHFVEVGEELESAMARALRDYNRLQSAPPKKTVTVGIEEPLNPQLERMLNLLEYAGIIRRVGSVSRGEKGRFQRYDLHHAIVIAENALGLGRSFTVGSIVSSLSTRDAHAFVRTRAAKLLGTGFEKRCTLDLPPCKKCGTPRVAEEQHFCLKCGAELTDVSVYEELLKAPIDRLPLTRKKLDGIRRHTSLKTVQDVLLDDEAQQLRGIPYVGPVWSARIRTYAEEFVSV